MILIDALESDSPTLVSFSIFTSVLSLEQYWTIKSLLVLLFFRINNSRSLIKEAYDWRVVPLWCPRASGLIKTGRDRLVSLSDIGWASPYQVVLFWLSEASVPGLQLCSMLYHWHHLPSPALPQVAFVALNMDAAPCSCYLSMTLLLGFFLELDKPLQFVFVLFLQGRSRSEE